MAKYAKKRKKRASGSTTRRRRRIGAAKGILNPNSPVLLLGSAALGYLVAADMINGGLDKIVPASLQANTNYGMIAGAAEAGGGLFLAMAGKKTMPKQIIGGILLGAGLKRVLKATGVITGFRDIPAVGNMAMRRRMAGFRDIPAVGAFNPLQGGNRSLGTWRPQPAASSLGSVSGAGAGCF